MDHKPAIDEPYHVLPRIVRAHPLASIGATLGAVAMLYAGVAVVALERRAAERVGENRSPEMTRFENALLGVRAARIRAETEGLGAFRADRGNRLDHNRDGILDERDVQAQFQILVESESTDPHVGLALTRFLELGGCAYLFDLLDLDGDQYLTIRDLQRLETALPGKGFASFLEPAHAEWAGEPTIDPRNNTRLVLDPLRASWLQEMSALDQGGQIRFRGNAFPRESFGSGRFARLWLRDGTSVDGFVSRDDQLGRATVLTRDGTTRVHRYPPANDPDVDRLDLEVLKNAPENQWYKEVLPLLAPERADDSRAWGSFAIRLNGMTGMASEAMDAAKRALIYDPSLSELWPIVGVERRDGELRRVIR